MAVRCRQTDDVVQEYVIEPHSSDQTDAQLLRLKSKGAQDKGWNVKKTSPTSFTATKVRWGGVVCVREFWIEAD
jgi:hypothetical protein